MTSELAEKLDAFIGEEYATTEQQGFVIDTADKADWALRKIAKYQGAINEAKALAEKRIQQINAWLAATEEDNQKQISFFGNILEPWAKEQMAGLKKRSMKLPAGTFGFRAQQPKFIKDDDQLLAWAEKSAPEFVRQVPKLEWTELKKAARIVEKELISPDGEVVPGVTVEEQPDKFYVKAGE